ncbi:MAG: PAS domain S-box protein [Flavobacterium sp.]
MKVSFEIKILSGFICNLLVISALCWIFAQITDQKRDISKDWILEVTAIFLLFLAFILLTIVYIIIRSQFIAKNKSQQLLSENRQLLQSIIENAQSLIYIKKINGEYTMVNKYCAEIFQKPINEIIGKTDHDLHPKEIADAFRSSDLKVVQKLRELKTEEKLLQGNEEHIYLSAKFPLYDSDGRVYAIGGISTDITERKKSEQSLKVSDNFFEMSMAILFIASDDKFIKINPALSSALGYTESELLRESFLNFIHPEDADFTQKEITKLKTGFAKVAFESRWICKNQSVKWIEFTITYDPLENVIYAVGQDKSLQKIVEESLNTANNFFELSFNGILVTKGKKAIKINPAFIEITGYDLNDLKDRSITDLVHPDYKKIAEERINKRLQGIEVEATVEYPIMCKDGTYRWVEIITAADVRSGTLYAVLQDINQRKLNEEKLKLYTKKLEEDEKQIQTIFDSAPDPVILIDSESKVIKWNIMAEKVYGWTKEEVIGKSIYDIILSTKHKKALSKGIQRYITSGVNPISNNNYEMLAINKAGEKFPISLSASPVKIGEKQYFIGFTRDITDVKNLIDNLYENEETLRLIIENIGEGVLVANANREIVMANEMTNEILGIEKPNNVNFDLSEHFELYFPDEKTIFPSQNLPTNKALEGEETNNVDVVLWDPVKQNKKRVLISGRPLIDQNEQVVAAIITIKDISKYKELEDELKDTETKYRNLIGFRKDNNK